MATYTEVSRESLARFLIMFDLGELESFEAISAGIENSNYFVTLENELEFVLTITEDIDLGDVPFFNDLLTQLVNAGLPVPEPQRTLDGMPSTIFKGKPTWLFTRLGGTHITQPGEEQCLQIGRALATIHQAAEKCRFERPHAYDASWATSTFEQVKQQLSHKDLNNLGGVVSRYEAFCEDLPRGIVHGDLFRDNAMFDGPELTGVIDFYHACDDYLIQDLAITINDWCMDGMEVNGAKQRALIEGYESLRKLSQAEADHLEAFRLFAAMRFALTRLVAASDDPERKPQAKLELLHHLLT